MPRNRQRKNRRENETKKETTRTMGRFSTHLSSQAIVHVCFSKPNRVGLYSIITMYPPHIYIWYTYTYIRIYIFGQVDDKLIDLLLLLSIYTSL